MPIRKLVFLCTAAVAFVSSTPTVATGTGITDVSIQGTRFLINGSVTYPGTDIEGLLLNSRMVQAVFDDENLGTAEKWAYPDTGAWDPERNVSEFVAQVPTYAAEGLGAVTIGLQGGHPGEYSRDRIVSAFTSDGSLKSAWLDRLDRAISACDAAGIVVIVSLFYQLQDHHLTDEAAVQRGVDNIVDWLEARGHENVIIEIANESSVGNYDHHPILQPARIDELIVRAQQRSSGTIPVSASFPSGGIPPPDVRSVADLFLMHGNALTPEELTGKVATLRSKSEYQDEPRPIVFNEAGSNVDLLDAAVSSGASWGYYDQGENNYVDGFQSPPVNWSINTDLKRSFFSRVRFYAHQGSSSDTAPPSAPSDLAAIAAAHDRVDLSWTAATDDVGVTAYDVYRDGWLLSSGVTSTSYADITVTGSTTYSYEVVARDAAGNSSTPSEPAWVTTPTETDEHLFVDDFETGDLSRWTTSSGFSVQRDTVYAGRFAGRAASTGPRAHARRDLGAGVFELFGNLRVHVTGIGSQPVTVFRFTADDGTSVVRLLLNNRGRLCIRDDVKPAKTECSTALQTGTWHEIQVRVLIGDPEGRSEVWLNDVPVLDLWNTMGLGTDPVAQVEIGESAAGSTFDIAFDDVVVSPTYVG